MASKTQIGWFNLKEDTEFHDNGYECAAWSQNVLVKAGRYPIEVYDLKFLDDGRIDFSCRGVYISMEGTITTDYFPSMYCGVPVAPYDEHKNTGRKAEYHDYMYTYMLAELVMTDDSTYELFPEYEARSHTFWSDTWNEEITTHDIYRKQ